MVQVESPHITVSEQLFLELMRENPGVRFERARDGTLIVMPPNGLDGSRQNLQIVWQLENWNRALGGGVVFDSSGGFRLQNGAIRSPDAAWLQKAQWQQLSAEQRCGFAPICPEFVIELLSPTDDLTETRAKLDEFVRSGASLGWLVDPSRRIVEIYRPSRAPEMLENPLTVEGEGALSGFVLGLEPIFDDPSIA
jgi:Uma2 family endonuclease